MGVEGSRVGRRLLSGGRDIRVASSSGHRRVSSRRVGGMGWAVTDALGRRDGVQVPVGDDSPTVVVDLVVACTHYISPL